MSANDFERGGSRDRDAAVARWIELLGERGPEADAERARLASGPHADAVERLDAFLSRSAAQLRSEGPPQALAQSLAERVLEQTTRRPLGGLEAEDLARWGDLRLVVAQARRSLRQSGLLRLAAASLLVHVFALPVLAYFVLRAEPRVEPRIVFELERDLPAVLDESIVEPEIVDWSDAEVLDDPLDGRSALDRERLLLRERRAPEQGADGLESDAPKTAGWRAALDARSRLVRTLQQPPEAWAADTEGVRGSALERGLELVLRAELALDGFVFLGQEPAQLGRAAELLDAAQALEAASHVEPLARSTRRRLARYRRLQEGAASARDPIVGRSVLDAPWREQLRSVLERGPGIPDDLEGWLR